MTPLLSVVVPMYNEEDTLGPLMDRLRPALDGLPATYEVVAVDDGSTDATPRMLARAQETWSRLRVVRLRRNSGHQAALTAGLHSATGDYVVSIDADLQDPPEKIAEMLELAQRSTLDVVYGVRTNRRKDRFFKRSTASAYYRLMHRMVGSWVPRNAADFRLMSRATVDTLLALPDHRPVYRLLVPSLGFPSGTITYVREERVAGRTKYPLATMIRLAVDSLTSFSAAPLRLATWLGLISFCGCLAMIAFGIVVYATGSTVPGWTSLFVAVLFLGGLQLICLGLLGEYVGRIYSTVQNRPAFHVAHEASAGEPEPADTALAEGAPLSTRG